ncbi:NAD transporter [Ceratobasidium theobromae]|uniref:NAD transporter n=1 Tax=Ceratobasidium theobromae TaxID=1582974 RepID=A0A5N5QGB4_9AGAM|nr:NAD transporter [Ceratobasidium theobromae]
MENRSKKPEFGNREFPPSTSTVSSLLASTTLDALSVTIYVSVNKDPLSNCNLRHDGCEDWGVSEGDDVSARLPCAHEQMTKTPSDHQLSTVYDRAGPPRGGAEIMHSASKWQKPMVANSVIAGAGAGLVSSIVTCPLDVIKTKLQAQSIAHGSHGYQGTQGTIAAILKHQGIRGLYRGLGPTILGYLPTWAIYFSVYDETKKRLGDNEYNDPSLKDGYTGKRKAWATHIIAAMTAGASGSIATSPLWVIKTRFMTQPQDESPYRHTWDAFRTIYRTEGWRAFYRGLFPSLLGVTHVAVQFPLYEQLKHWFGTHRFLTLLGAAEP